MKRISIVFLLLCPLFLVGQGKKGEYVQFYYPGGQVSSEGYMTGGKPNGYWKSYYPDGVLKSEGKRENFVLDSIWTFYNERGLLSHKISYDMGSKTGYMFTYKMVMNSDSVWDVYLSEKEMYVNGKKQGEAYYYHPNGKSKSLLTFKDGEKDGPAWMFDQTGMVTAQLMYMDNRQVESERINRYGPDGLKQGVWKEFYPDMKLKKEMNYKNDTLNGYYKEYETSGKVKNIILYKMGRIVDPDEIKEPVELKKEYFEDGSLKSEGRYVEDKPVGEHKKYDKKTGRAEAKIYDMNGNLMQEGLLGEEGKTGEWRLYYSSGELKAKGMYENGKREGEWVFYYPEGMVEQRGRYRKGREEGEWAWFFQDGSIRRKEHFYQGKEDGELVEYDEQGELITKGKYIDGEKEGDWYYNVGDHVEQGAYRFGLRVGEWKYYYYPESLIHFEGSYAQGLEDGQHLYYHKNGTRKEERHYIMGTPHDTWRKFDEAGNMIMSITYDAGREIKINGNRVEEIENEE